MLDPKRAAESSVIIHAELPLLHVHRRMLWEGIRRTGRPDTCRQPMQRAID